MTPLVPETSVQYPLGEKCGLARWFFEGESVAELSNTLNNVMKQSGEASKFRARDRKPNDATFFAIADSIDVGLPVLLGWNTKDYGDHAVLVTGYWHGKDDWLPASCITSRRNLHTSSISRHRLVLRIQSPSRREQRRERRPSSVCIIVTRCEEDAHGRIGPKSPAFMGRASPFPRNFCIIRGYS